jgi:hypothetical protein
VTSSPEDRHHDCFSCNRELRMQNPNAHRLETVMVSLWPDYLDFLPYALQ